MKIRLGGVQYLATAETDKVSLNLYLQGCNRHCPGCHNPELQSHSGGTEYTLDEIYALLKEQRKHHDALCVLGGEPLEQAPGLALILQKAGELGYERYVYTGCEHWEVPDSVFKHCDVIKCGEYVEELKSDGILASSNQYFMRITRG